MNMVWNCRQILWLAIGELVELNQTTKSRKGIYQIQEPGIKLLINFNVTLKRHGNHSWWVVSMVDSL